jgi:ribosome-associated protein
MKSKEDFSENDAQISKTQRRREALELKSLASRLINLSPARLARVPLDGPLRASIEEARQIRSNVARKRQLQYVAKLLRRLDPEPIVRIMNDFDNEARQLNARHHRSEDWRDYLLESGDRALGELIGHRHDVDAQAIRTLIRNAKKDTATGKPPAAARALFRLLRDLDELDPLPLRGL